MVRRNTRMDVGRKDALEAVAGKLEGLRPLPAGRMGDPLDGFQDELGKNGRVRPLLWHARYSEFADAFETLRSSSWLKDGAVDSGSVEGIGGHQAFRGVEVRDEGGNLLRETERDQELAVRLLQGLREAVRSVPDPPDAPEMPDLPAALADHVLPRAFGEPERGPAQLWSQYLIDGLPAQDVASDAGISVQTFDRRTWRGGLGRPADYQSSWEADLRRLVRCLDRAFEQPVGSGLEGLPLPPVVADRRIGPFVGRRDELDGLAEDWDTVRRGGARVVFISGGTGMGKSQLVFEFASSLGPSAVVVGGQPSGSGERAHGDMTDIVGQLLTAAAASVDEADFRPLRPLLAAAPALEGSGTDPAADREALHVALIRLLRRVAGATPTLVVIENFHAVSQDSLSLIVSLVESAIPQTLVVLVHQDVPGARRATANVEAAADQAAVRVRLLELSNLEQGDVAELSVGVDPGAPAELAALLYEYTRGYPVLVTRFLESYRDDPEALMGLLREGRAPRRVDRFVLSRLDRLTPAAQELTQMAAVLAANLHFDLSVLAACLGRPLDNQLARDVQEVNDARFVSDVPGVPAQRRFVYEIEHSAIYGSIDSFDAALKHQRAARAIGPDCPPDLVATYAHHCCMAAEVLKDMRPEAFRASMAAGHDSMARLAHAGAADHFRQAHRHADAYADVLRAQAALGDALGRLGDSDQACLVLRGAAEDALGRDLDEDSVELLAAIVTTLSWAAHRSNAHDAGRRALYEQVMGLLPEGEAYWRVRLLAAIGRETPPREAPRVLPGLAARAGDLAATHPGPATQAYGLLLAYEAQLDDLIGTERAGIAERMVDAACAAEDPYLMTCAYGYVLHTALERLDRASVYSAVVACVDIGDRFNYEYARWQGLAYIAGLALVERPLEEARRAIERSRAVGESLRYGEVVQMQGVLDAFLYRELGEHRVIEDIVREGVRQSDLTAWKAGLACGLSEGDGGVDSDEAREVIAGLEAGGLGNLPHDGAYPLTLAFLANAYACLGDERGAGQLLPLVQACAGRHPVAAATATYWGSMAYHAGLLHATIGDYKAALRSFDAARRVDRGMKARLWGCHTRVAQIQARRARSAPGDRDEADRLERQVRRLAQHYGYLRVLKELDGQAPAHIRAR